MADPQSVPENSPGCSLRGGASGSGHGLVGDLAGRYPNQPVYKLLGAYRDRVKAYASTMCGDEMEGGLSTPEGCADFAEACKKRGYKALKLHTWMPPIPGAPDPKRDVAACRAVRERVGEDMVLMLDCFHHYTREEALYIGKELESLNFHGLQEPMDEHSISSYVWLARQLSIPVVGPETAEDKMFTRAEWIVLEAYDISRGGVGDLGGITPLMKTIHLCESFGVRFGSSRWRPGQPPRPVLYGYPRGSTTSVACCTHFWTMRNRSHG